MAKSVRSASTTIRMTPRRGLVTRMCCTVRMTFYSFRRLVRGRHEVGAVMMRSFSPSDRSFVPPGCTRQLGHECSNGFFSRHILNHCDLARLFLPPVPDPNRYSNRLKHYLVGGAEVVPRALPTGAWRRL